MHGINRVEPFASLRDLPGGDPHFGLVLEHLGEHEGADGPVGIIFDQVRVILGQLGIGRHEAVETAVDFRVDAQNAFFRERRFGLGFVEWRRSFGF